MPCRSDSPTSASMSRMRCRRSAFDSSGMCSADAFADDLLDRHPRRQRAERVLEHHLHPPPHRAQRRAVGAVDALAVDRDAAGGDGLQREQRHAEGGLAGARLADDAERLAALQLERRVAHGAEHVLAEPAAGRHEVHRHVARRGQHGRVGRHRLHRALRPAVDQLHRVGMLRACEHLCRRPLLDQVALLHHADAMGEAADQVQVVRDEQDRHAVFALQVVEQREDLRLDRHVERGGGLVGDQQLRAGTRAPSRSSRAGAGRPTAGAGTHRPAARDRECRYARGAPPRAPARSSRPAPRAARAPRRSGCRRCRADSARSSAPGRSSRCRGRAAAASPARSCASTFSPWKRISPVYVAVATSFRIDSAVTDLPEPDSPTNPNFSPASIVNDTLSTTRDGPKLTHSTEASSYDRRSSGTCDRTCGFGLGCVDLMTCACRRRRAARRR